MAGRAAVLIGIEQIDSMALLPGAVHGANNMAQWTRDEGWENIRVFTDEGGPVSDRDISNHIDALIQSCTVGQLLVYFAGHGQCRGVEQDYWLLSGTRLNGDVINVANSVALARQSGIPFITFVADACRSVGPANDAAIGRIAVSIFPAAVNPASRTKVDEFYATKPTQAALEVKRRVEQDGASPDDATSDVNAAVEEAHGVFTKCLLAALRGNEDAVKSRLPDDRIVVQPQRLAEFLEHHVPREAGRRRGGFAQRPDCRPRSDQVLAEVQAAEHFQLQVEARLPDDVPAEGIALELLRYDQTDPNLLVTERRIQSRSLSERLPRGNTYGIRATLSDHHQEPSSPNPMTMLMADEKVTVKMVPETTLEAVTRAPFEMLGGDMSRSPDDLSIHSAFVLTDGGERYAEAPGDGVFAVLEVDGVTGDEFRSRQLLRRVARPERLIRASHDTEHAVQEAAGLPYREGYETQAGLTILGVQQAGVYDHASFTHTFEEDNVLHVRGEVGSGSLVLDLGEDRFAALARFQGFVGRVRVTALGVESLHYMPSRGADTESVESASEPTEEFRHRARTALAIAEAAARYGKFDLAIDRARPVARILRQYKHYNPVLGVFAAYAYHQVGDVDQICDMIHYFIHMNQAVPFDVYLLSGMKRDEIPCGVAPGYPLLTQGWLQLGNNFHPAVAAARRSMAPTLWATIMGDAGREIGEAVQKGEVT